MRITVESAGGISKEKVVTNVLRHKISNGIFYCNSSKQKDFDFFSYGISTPKILIDRRTNRPCLSYIPIRDVFSVKIIKRKQGKGFLIELPDKKIIHTSFKKRRENLLLQAENILLESIGKNLVTIARVQNGLNPFKEILLSLITLQEIPLVDLFKRKKRNRMEKYLQFLSDLDYIVFDNARIVPGNQLVKFDLATDAKGTQETIVLILGDLINRGREFITRDLSIYMLEPYLSLSSTVYIHSFLADKDIRMSIRDIGTYIKNTYPHIPIKADFHLNSYLIEMKGANIVESEGNYYSGKDEILHKFKVNFADITSY